MSVEEKLLGIATGALILGVFYGMFFFVFRHVNLSYDEEKEKEK